MQYLTLHSLTLKNKLSRLFIQIRRKNVYSDELYRQMVNMVEFGIFKRIKSHFLRSLSLSFTLIANKILAFEKDICPSLFQKNYLSRDKVTIKQEAPLEPLSLEHFVLPLIMLATCLRNIMIFSLSIVCI